MRDHAILDLLVHAGRHDLLALQLILAGVGASLHDGLGACLADAGQLRKFRFGCAVQVQLADRPRGAVLGSLLRGTGLAGGFLGLVLLAGGLVLKLAAVLFQRILLLLKGGCLAVGSFAHLTGQRNLHFRHFLAGARQQFGLVGGVQRRCAECQRQRGQQAQRRSAHRGEGGGLVLLHEYLP